MNNTVTWAIQSNLIDAKQTSEIVDAVRKIGCNIQDIIIIPFSEEFGNEIPDIGDMVIPYGSTKLNKMAQERNWKGNWFDPETFRVEAWNANRDDMLNAECVITTVAEVHKLFEDVSDDEVRFIRPVKDLKEFNGTVTTVKEIKNWMNSVYSGNFSFSADTLISIAPVQKIVSEARYFIVGGKVINGSMYRIYGQLFSQPITNTALYEQAQRLADIWLPHPCCVMDVAELEDSTFKVIEFNAINSSGFYYHDIAKIAQAMTNYVKENN
jgi:ATP-grasp domain, R2K clade family 3